MLLKQEEYQNIGYQHHQNILDLRWGERAQMEIDTLWKVTIVWMINEVTLQGEIAMNEYVEGKIKGFMRYLWMDR